MAKGLLGRKVGMTQVYDDSGRAIPVTVIEAGPCHVLQLRTVERDGYEAVQLGFADKRRPAVDRPRSRFSQARRSERGQVTAKLNSKRSKRRLAAGVQLLPKAECEPKVFIRELRGAADGLEVGQQVTVRRLAGVAAVDVVGDQQGPRLFGCHAAAQFRRPAGYARREEGASPPRQYGHERLSQPQFQGWPQGGSLWCMIVSRSAICRWCGWMSSAMSCW